MLNKISTVKKKYKQHAENQTYVTDVNAASLYGASIQSHLILWISFIFVIIALIWANFAELDEVTRGSGKTTPSSHIQVIQNLEGGILAEILVREGETVEKGQALLQLDAVRFASSLNETKLKYHELLAATARLTAEVNNTTLVIPDDVLKNAPEIAKNAVQLFKSRRKELNAATQTIKEQISQYTRGYALLQEELEMSAPLVDEGAMSKVELLRIKREANSLKGQLTEARNKLHETKVRFQTKALEELNQTKAELDRTSESTFALEDRVTRTRVLSPVKGVIKQLKVTTVGGVIQPGMDLVEIVPIDDQLLIEAQIRPADIAFLHPGQKAMVKLTAYDFSIYGGLEAELEHISADSITNEEDGKNYYMIRLRTKKNYLERNGVKLSIIAGMTADVDILTGKKTVLDYLLKPILKAKERALKER
ncbi:HlyD family type I secretion periplasmic adaptor subunit [uncultured Cycloclasticus sp.]|uniref:HlyD family type I secretion periplasmic adaptor subunit n=1 Tax=uncultured Cycloclasticus sp. TaxID=172194 RepID=UPI00258D3195|nr:HlyD family type I secretion periplasmic adaptor subunit [uncultured Cycloclasticus sp.]